MMGHLDSLVYDDIGGLSDSKPWVLLEGGETWQAMHRRLRDNPPKGVIITAHSIKASFMQAWRRAELPQIAVLVSTPKLLE